MKKRIQELKRRIKEEPNNKELKEELKRILLENTEVLRKILE
jgi:hypothetical protein